MNELFNQASISSDQIAAMVEKRHDSVKRTIDFLLKDGAIQLPHHAEVKNHLGQSVSNYIFTGEQGRIDSITLVAQLSPKFTAALVKRWDELEKGTAQPIALPQDYLSALKALVDSEEEKQIAQAQVMELLPKAAALDTLSHAKNSLGIRETAKAVGIPERKFIARCTDEAKPVSSRFMYRDDKGVLNAYSHRIKQGFLTQKVTSYQGRNGKDFVTIKVKFTAAGIAHVAKLMQIKPVKQLKQLEAV